MGMRGCVCVFIGDNAKTRMNGIWNAGGVRDMKSIEFIQFICK